MSLAAFIKRRSFGGVATAISATTATDGPKTDASVAKIATIAIAKAAVQGSEQAIDHAGCKQCLHETKFGNCSQPVAASLCKTFKLVAHPRFGKGCKAFKNKAAGTTHDLCSLIDEAQRQGAISVLEAQQAREAIAQQPNDQTYLDERVQLIQQCLVSSHLDFARMHQL